MKNNILKIFYIFLLMGCSLHVFVLNLNIIDLDFIGVDNVVYAFYLALFRSMESFEVIWIVIGIVLFDFYYDTYFILGNWKISRIFIIVISMISSSLILIFNSLYLYGNLSMIFDSFVQIYKCFMVGIGYYFIIYSILKRLFFSKIVSV